MGAPAVVTQADLPMDGRRELHQVVPSVSKECGHRECVAIGHKRQVDVVLTMEMINGSVAISGTLVIDPGLPAQWKGGGEEIALTE